MSIHPGHERHTPAGAAQRALRWARHEPFVHFLALGGLLFVIYAAAGSDEESEPAPASAARGEPDRRIVITAADVERLRNDFRLAWRREPSADEMGDQVEAFVHEEMLFREGSALGLDRDDVVVRRRIVEKMTALARPAAPAPEPSAAELRAWFARYPHRFRQPGRLTFEQRFFDPKRHADAAAAAATAVTALGQRSTDVAALAAGDDFVLPRRMEDRSDLQVAHLYGEAFAQALTTAPVGRWTAPVTSQFGTHAIFLVARTAAKVPELAEVEAHVKADWLTVNTRGQKAAAESLLGRYSIALEGKEAEALARSPAVAPLVKR